MHVLAVPDSGSSLAEPQLAAALLPAAFCCGGLYVSMWGSPFSPSTLAYRHTMLPGLDECQSCTDAVRRAYKATHVQDEVTENQRQLITANWGKLNLSRQGVERAKQTMVAALTAASQGPNMYHLTDRTASTSLAAEQVKAALEVRPATSSSTVNTTWHSLLACCLCNPCVWH